MAAATQRAAAAASNIANAQSAGALPGNPGPPAYAPVGIVQAAAGPEGGGGTIANAVPASPAYMAAYDPGSPVADANGLVAMPAVDPVQQVAQLATARLSFAANLKTVQTALSMTDALLAIV
ncbi:MAG: flagellar biosynthesis protein FlgC [Alphaproteobacteria bacterium]|nr:flagellar biosynthesis protein FlgC [Alphaproteobacteria bacterium]